MTCCESMLATSCHGAQSTQLPGTFLLTTDAAGRRIVVFATMILNTDGVWSTAVLSTASMTTTTVSRGSGVLGVVETAIVTGAVDVTKFIAESDIPTILPLPGSVPSDRDASRTIPASNRALTTMITLATNSATYSERLSLTDTGNLTIIGSNGIDSSTRSSRTGSSNLATTGSDGGDSSTRFSATSTINPTTTSTGSRKGSTGLIKASTNSTNQTNSGIIILQSSIYSSIPPGFTLPGQFISTTNPAGSEIFVPSPAVISPTDSFTRFALTMNITSRVDGRGSTMTNVTEVLTNGAGSITTAVVPEPMVLASMSASVPRTGFVTTATSGSGEATNWSNGKIISATSLPPAPSGFEYILAKATDTGSCQGEQLELIPIDGVSSQVSGMSCFEDPMTSTASHVPDGAWIETITSTTCAHAMQMVSTTKSGESVTSVVPKLCIPAAGMAFLLFHWPQLCHIQYTFPFTWHWSCANGEVHPPGPGSGGIWYPIIDYPIETPKLGDGENDDQGRPKTQDEGQETKTGSRQNTDSTTKTRMTQPTSVTRLTTGSTASSTASSCILATGTMSGCCAGPTTVMYSSAICCSNTTVSNGKTICDFPTVTAADVLTIFYRGSFDTNPDDFISMPASPIIGAYALLAPSALSRLFSGTGLLPGDQVYGGTGQPGSATPDPTISGSITSRGSRSSDQPPMRTANPTMSTITTAKPTNSSITCMLDGAPSSSQFCVCGPTATYKTLSVPASITGIDAKSAMCAYSSLDPADIVAPILTPMASMLPPVQSSKPACHGIAFSPDSKCPYAEHGYCDCEGILVPSLSNDTQAIDCGYQTKPTANDCPVVSSYSASLAAASASSASAAVASANIVSASLAANSPQETSYNHEGSSLCGDISKKDCLDAFEQYVDAITYYNHTAYIASAGDTIINTLLGGRQGCTAKTTCNSSEEAAYLRALANSKMG
ncbi:MAG: hypothetical protein Q9175_006939 [Cornicularia normoerica]